MRGGIEAHGADVLARAGDLGLRVRESFVGHEVPSPEEAEGADVWLYRARIPDAVLRGLYRAAHAVLAQSGLEPFGLVGLEAMAQGGLVLTGASGEDYARHRWNALVVESGGSWEVAQLIERGLQDPDLVRSIRRAAQETAAAYTWERLVPELLERMAMAERWG
jgi:glycosyltransferase involved in cell wall biosynthesis